MNHLWDRPTDVRPAPGSTQTCIRCGLMRQWSVDLPGRWCYAELALASRSHDFGAAGKRPCRGAPDPHP